MKKASIIRDITGIRAVRISTKQSSIHGSRWSEDQTRRWISHDRSKGTVHYEQEADTEREPLFQEEKPEPFMCQRNKLYAHYCSYNVGPTNDDAECRLLHGNLSV